MIASPAGSNSVTQSAPDLDSRSVLEGLSASRPEIKGFIQVTLSETRETNPLSGINLKSKCVYLPQGERCSSKKTNTDKFHPLKIGFVSPQV